MTANDLIRRALRSLGVLHTGESPSADEAADALDTLNDMMNAWRQEGIDLEFIADLTTSSDLPYPDDHIAAFRYNLALELAPEYGAQVPAVVVGMAKRTYQALKTQYMVPATLAVDDALRPIYNPNYREGFYEDFA